MSTFRLDRYVLRMYVFHLLLVLVGMVGLYLVIDLFEKLRWIQRQRPDFQALALFFWYRLPLAVSHVLPLASLFAGILTTTRLSRSGELTAFRAAGIAPPRVLVALLLGGALTGTVLWCTTELWLPSTQVRLELLQEERLGRPSSRSKPSNDRWYGDSRQLVHIGDLREPALLRDVEVLELDASGNLRHHLLAPVVRWQGSGWVVPSAERWTVEQRETQRYEAVQDLPLPLPLTPDALRRESLPLEALTSSMLRARLQVARDTGIDSRGLATTLELRLLLPLSCVLLVLIGAPRGARMGRDSGVSMAIAEALVISLVYFGTTVAGLITASSASAPLTAGIWIPQVVWIAGGTIGWWRLR